MQAEINLTYIISEPIDKGVSLPQHAGSDNIILQLDSSTVEGCKKEVRDVLDLIRRTLIEK